jgi:hypothetical protein
MIDLTLFLLGKDDPASAFGLIMDTCRDHRERQKQHFYGAKTIRLCKFRKI